MFGSIFTGLFVGLARRMFLLVIITTAVLLSEVPDSSCRISNALNGWIRDMRRSALERLGMRLWRSATTGTTTGVGV